MEFRIGVCKSCQASYRIPANFDSERAKCRQCNGVVEIGPLQRAEHEPPHKRGRDERPRESRRDPVAAALAPLAQMPPAQPGRSADALPRAGEPPAAGVPDTEAPSPVRAGVPEAASSPVDAANTGRTARPPASTQPGRAPLPSRAPATASQPVRPAQTRRLGQPEPDRTAPAAERGKRPLVLVACALVVALLIYGGWQVFGARSGGSTSGTASAAGPQDAPPVSASPLSPQAPPEDASVLPQDAAQSQPLK